MIVVCQAVDDRHVRVLRQFQNVLVPEEPRHDDVIVPVPDIKMVGGNFHQVALLSRGYVTRFLARQVLP